jgi:hypothetical protein
MDAGDVIAALAVRAQEAAHGKPEMERRRFAKLARAFQARTKSANRPGTAIAEADGQHHAIARTARYAAMSNPVLTAI